MNNWSIKVFAIEKDGRSMSFSPSAAKEAGYLVQPLVEIDPADILNALSEDFLLSIDHVYLLNIKIIPKEALYINTSPEFACPVTMHKSHFLNQISSGVYLEAAFISDDILLFMLGDEESWIVLDPGQYRKRQPSLDHLIMISKNNIKVLRKEDRFDKF